MKPNRILSNIAVLAFAAMLALSGCKQGKQQQANNQQPNNQQPTAEQSAVPSEPTSSMPGVQTQPPTEQPGAQATNEAPGGYEQPGEAAQAPAPVVIPAGTRVPVRIGRELGSAISEPGQSFTATITDDIVADGMTVIPRGSRAEGTVVEAKSRGHIKGAAVLAIRLNTLQINGANYPVTTSTYEKALAGKGKRSAKFIGGGAGLGALIGGLSGGGKGAAIGAAAGAGAGTAGAAYTGNKQIVLPAGTVVTFKLQRALRLG